jgi:hypothetical protein
MSTEIAIIRRAREIISDPEKWTQHAGAREASGFEVVPHSTVACRWCAWGAIQKAAREIVGQGIYVHSLRAAARLDTNIVQSGLHPLFAVNDQQGHAAVLSLFDKALAMEAAQP